MGTADNLAEFISELERDGELVRVKHEVDPDLEITEIIDRTVKAGGPALLFENVKGYPNFPILTNIFGSRARMARVMGSERPEEITRDYLSLLDRAGMLSFMEKVKMGPKLLQVSSYMPKEIARGKAPCQEVVWRGEDARLSRIPVCKCWPLDGGKYITMGMTSSIDPRTGHQNYGLYRNQVYDDKSLGMHWQIHKDGAEHGREAGRRGEKIPVSIALGADPVTVASGAFPLPPDISELMIAGFIRRKPVKVVKSMTNDTLVPAEAEIVMEGYVDPADMRTEGPFGDHKGYYSLEDLYPTFHLECITTRKNPVYLHTIVGPPPMEDAYWGEAIERLFLPLIQKQLPEIVDMHLPASGLFHNLALVSIRKSYPGQARKTMHALWGLGQLMFSKIIIVVDEDVNLRDYNEVVWRATNNLDPKRDMEIVTGPIDALDHASPLPNFGSKIGFDCTEKGPDEGVHRPLPTVIKMDEEVKKKVDKMWGDLGIEKKKDN